MKDSTIKLTFQDKFIGQNSLLEEDLKAEAKYLAQIDYLIKWS